MSAVGKAKVIRVAPPLAPPAKTAVGLEHPDWLFHVFIVSGPAADVKAFQVRARGAPALPWHLDLDAEEERLLLPMISEGAAARILARQLRDAVAAHHERVLAQITAGGRYPLDLHRLIPVPADILRLGSDDPASLLWLWENWGTTKPLRYAEILEGTVDRRLRRTARITYRFYSADWTPWRAILRLRVEWPDLVFDVRPQYGRE